MARRCIVCDKHTATGNQRSHALNKTRRVWKPNLQKIRVRINGAPQRAYVCTRCLKGNKIERVV